MNESQKISKMEKFIHVTGFGPFRGFTDTNPSWEAVSLLPDEICVNNVKYTIKKHNVLVTYGAVNDIVPKLWASKPTLVVHCGADHSAKAIKMEQSAYNGHFCEADFEGKYLDEHNVCLEKSGKCIKLCTHLNLNQIINDCGDHNLEHSMHPGNYLCGYIYLRSLDYDANRCLFIHVPPICDKFTVEKIRDGIAMIINKCLLQLETDCSRQSRSS